MDILALKDKFCVPGYERMVLSFCFKDINYYYEIASRLTESDFLLSDHQLLFLIMKSLVDSGTSVLDMASVSNYAQKSDLVDAIGGLPYLQSIINIETHIDNFESYIDTVIEASAKYKLYSNLLQHSKFVEKNAFTDIRSSTLIDTVESDLLNMSIKSELIEEPIHLGDSLLEFINDRSLAPVMLTGLSTGYPIFDSYIDGLIAGCLHIIAARKKMGKSTFLTNVALYIACKLQIPILYIDTELSFKEWRTRVLSRVSGVKERRIKHGTFSDMERKKLENAANLLSKCKIYHKYMPGYTVPSVLALAKKFKIKENIGLLVFDYLKEPEKTNDDSYRKEYQLLGDATTKLKDLAGILNIPIITAVQLNRSNDIADSDKIARYGDVVAFWSPRTEEERQEGGPRTCGNFKLCIKDSRRGGETSEKGIGFWFFKEFLHIREVAPPEQYFISLKSDESDYGTESDIYNLQVGADTFA